MNRRRVTADANGVLFFNRGEPYHVSHPLDGGDDCTVFAFAANVLGDALAPYDADAANRPDRPFTLTHGPCEPHALLGHYRLRSSVSGAAVEALAFDELAVDLLGSVVASAYRVRGRRRSPARRGTRRAHRQAVDDARALLSSNLRFAMTLDQIARSVGCSPFHLARLFRRHVGLPMHRHRNRLRLAASVERLAEGERDITRLALDLGFSSHSHFSDVFRRTFGWSPSQFRREATGRRIREMSKNLKV